MEMESIIGMLFKLNNKNAQAHLKYVQLISNNFKQILPESSVNRENRKPNGITVITEEKKDAKHNLNAKIQIYMVYI